MSRRPVEPHSTTEDPERWAEIAEWERERADTYYSALETLIEKSAKAQAILEDATYDAKKVI